jgi:hypothetical protein
MSETAMKLGFFPIVIAHFLAAPASAHGEPVRRRELRAGMTPGAMPH